MLAKKKILFIGSDTSLLASFAESASAEVISSVSFIDTILFSFVPDLIICSSVYDINPLVIRENKKLTFVPILILAEHIQELTSFEKILRSPRTLVCSRTVAEHPLFLARIESIVKEPESILGAKSGATVKKALLCIDRNLEKKLTRDFISDYCGANCDYLSRIFKAEMCMDLWTYITYRRLCEGKNILLTTGLSIKETALSLGFADDAYFNRLFAKEFKVSPGQFRKGHQFS